MNRFLQDLPIPENYITPPTDSNSKTLTLEIPDDDGNNNIKGNTYAVFTADVDENVETLDIKHNSNKNVQMIVKGENLKVAPEDKKALCKLVPEQNANLKFNDKSNGISIETNSEKTITLGNIPNEDGTIPDTAINLQNLTTNTRVTLRPESNVEFDYINLFNSGDIEKDSTASKTITANHVNIQQGADATLTNVIIKEDISVAPSSKIEIGDNVEYADKTIKILFSQAQKVGEKIFYGKLDKVPKSIVVSQKEANLILEDETMTIAKDLRSKFDDKTCEKWAEKVNGEFGDAKCEKLETENAVVAKKTTPPTKKKNKLSAGAIAGIVIACVVVVAVIIALLVYFLVIKKKNQSTTSTQGDSSIAI